MVYIIIEENLIVYFGLCLIRQFVQREKSGLKLKVVLKCSDIYVENIGVCQCPGLK